MIRTLTGLAALTVLITGCGQAVDFGGMNADSGQGPQFQSPTGSCAGSVIKNQYTVRWKDGHVSQEQSESDDTFVREFVLPNGEKISVAEPDYQVSTPERAEALMPVQPLSSADNWGPIDVQAGAAWSQGATGKGVVVAVVDTGIDRTHPQLAQQLALNPGENGLDAQGRNKATNGVDDDGNGFIDDWNGWNFVSNNNNPLDGYGHGTHVSGIIAAEHSDTVAGPRSYVEGIAPASKILPLKFLDDTGSGAISNAVLAITYAVGQGAQVINASWGGSGCSTVLQATVQDLIAKNILFVAAAGNSSLNLNQTTLYPASFSFLSQLTVGALDPTNLMASYSDYGSQVVQLFAPGSQVTSTFPGGEMAALSGTSMATPFVSGTAAILFGLKSSATLSQIRNAILESVAPGGYQSTTQGRLNFSTLLSRFQAP